MVVEMEAPTHGRFRTMAHPIRFSDTPARYELPPPALGQHTRQILSTAGFGAAEIERLENSGAI
jgi:crotonobetainyl-CoA:carnitine CoA-transferase CaiB-like acyl-CoA transferase